MRDLTKRDAKAANDLYGSYFLAKIKDLDGTAKSFNSALFEKGAKLEANPIFKFAPNPEAKKRIRELHATFKKAEAFEQLGLVKNADGKWVAQKMDTEMSHIIYVRPQAPVDQREPIQLRNNNSSISSQTQKDIDRYVEQGIAEQQN